MAIHHSSGTRSLRRNTMANFHNTPDGPAPCRAQNGRCPFGKNNEDHYSTKDEAQEAYDSKMSNKYGTTNSHKRKTSTSHSPSSNHRPMSQALRTHLRPAGRNSRASSGAFTRPARTSASANSVRKFAKDQTSRAVRAGRDNYKTLLMTKHWVPDPDSDAWKN